MRVVRPLLSRPDNPTPMDTWLRLPGMLCSTLRVAMNPALDASNKQARIGRQHGF